SDRPLHTPVALSRLRPQIGPLPRPQTRAGSSRVQICYGSDPADMVCARRTRGQHDCNLATGGRWRQTSLDRRLADLPDHDRSGQATITRARPIGRYAPASPDNGGQGRCQEAAPGERPPAGLVPRAEIPSAARVWRRRWRRLPPPCRRAPVHLPRVPRTITTRRSGPPRRFLDDGHPMHLARLMLLAATAATLSPATTPLRVMRVTPTTPAQPDAEITVMFDRPVAGGLEATVSPEAIFAIEPAVPGRVEWRDPVTLRFQPAEPLEPGRAYTVRITASFAAMDGSRLEGDYRHTFRVAPPAVLGGTPAGPNVEARHVTPEPRFDVLVSAPVDPAALAAAARLVMDRQCGGQSVPLRAAGIRQVEEGDPSSIRYTGYRGGWPWTPERDLRRVVALVPVQPLPLDCAG